MPKAAPIPEPTATPLDMIMDAFLYAGDFKWMFYATLIGFNIANARAIKGASPNINYFHGCALMVLTNYGGSTLAAVMCGKPVVFAVNEALVSVCLSVWTAIYLSGDLILKFSKDTGVGAVLTSICYETMRCHVLMNSSAMAANTLTSQLAVPAPDRVALVGPLIAGVLGGCGGGFMPLNKGLDPLANGTNWRIMSAMICSLWLVLSMQYPDTKAAIGLAGPTCKFLCVMFCVLPPLVQMLTGAAPLGANPLVAGPKLKKK